MNTGRDCFVILGGQPIFHENINIVRSNRIGMMRNPASGTFIQQVTAINTTINTAGLHAVMNWANTNAAAGAFIDEIGHYGLFISGWGFNGTSFGVTGNQLGAAIYSLATGTSTNNFIMGHSFRAPLEIDTDRAGVQAFGSDTNPNAIFWADGTQANALFAHNAGAFLSGMRRWFFESPTIEDSAGGTQQTGADFACQTTGLQTFAICIDDWQSGGAFANATANLAIGNNGNRLSSLNTSNAGAFVQHGSFQIFPQYTVATLPVSPNTPILGMVAFVIDATSPAKGVALTGGGNEVCLAIWNSTAWVGA